MSLNTPPSAFFFAAEDIVEDAAGIRSGPPSPIGFSIGASSGGVWNDSFSVPNRGLASGVQNALGLPTLADVGGPISNFTKAASPCGPNQRRFFDWLDNPTISGMAKHLGTTRTMIFTLAAKEGGWTADALDHNIPLNNPFGVNWSDKTHAKGNRNYNRTPFGAGLSDAVSDWENSVTAAPYVQGKTKPEDFVDALLAHGYNSNRKVYRGVFLSIAGSMPGHMKDCGVKP